jgi:hypothetical protein
VAQPLQFHFKNPITDNLIYMKERRMVAFLAKLLVQNLVTDLANKSNEPDPAPTNSQGRIEDLESQVEKLEERLEEQNSLYHDQHYTLTRSIESGSRDYEEQNFRGEGPDQRGWFAADQNAYVG